jgi:hypothetical protein
MIHTSSAIMKLVFHTASIFFNTILPTLTKTLLTNALKFPASTSKQNFVSVRWQLQNGVQVVHSLHDQTGYKHKVPDLGCEQVGKEQSILFLGLPHLCVSWCEDGHCREGKVRLSC